MTTTPQPTRGPVIECCPTCKQRVHVEDDGSYRPIAELQLRNARYRERQLQLFLLRLMDMTTVRPVRDYRAVIRDIHRRIYDRVGWQRSWIEDNPTD